MKSTSAVRASIRAARKSWTNLSRQAVTRLSEIANQFKFSVSAGDLIYLDNGWYVTHTGLLGLARRHRCAGARIFATYYEDFARAFLRLLL